MKRYTACFVLFLLMFVTAVKAQSPVTLSYSFIDQTAANTIQGHLNSGVAVIVTSGSSITIGNGVTILKSAGTDATLTFKANFRVTMNVNTSIKSTAGKLNLIFWSNATNDSATKGMIRFGDHTQPVANVIIESNGGHLWMGGGNTNTSWNGLTVGNGYAWGSASPSGNGWYGIELYGDCRFFTSGGNVSLNGRSTDQISGQGNTYAMYLIRSIINAGSGNIDINTLTDGTSPSGGVTTGIGISGDGGFTTTTGNITINNTIAVQGNTSGSATGIYLERSDSGNPVITSNQGNVSIVTSLSGAAAATKYYIDINEINFNREKSLAGASFTELVPDILEGGSSTFTSSNTAAATVTNSGLVSPVGIGVTDITGVFTRSDWSPVNSRWRYKLEIRSEADPILSFSQAEVYKNVSDASYTLTATQLNQSGTVGAITYTSSNRSVATVNSSTGAVTIVGEGSTVINATSARTVTYVKEGKASYTLYVVNGLVVFTSSVNSNGSGVTAYGNAVSEGGTAITERGFVYSLTSNPTTSNTKVVSGNGTGLFSQAIPGLSAATTYYVRAYAINSGGTSYGSEISFTTCSAIPQPLTITNSLCAANGLDWVTWSNVTTTTATGTMNGVGVTVTQSNPGLGTTSDMFGHANFPAEYTVPNGTTIMNEKSGTFTITFAKPINNPQVAFSSIGAPGVTVGITTSVPYSVIWQGPGMTYPTSTTMTGTEGYTIISFPGLHSSISMTYDTDESYANIAFGAENTNCSDPIICQNTPITLTASGGSTYLWSPSTGLSATNTASVIATPTVTTTYSVIDTSNACAVAGTVTVTVSNQVPNLSNSMSGTQYYASNSAIIPIVISNSGYAVTTGGYSVAPALPTGLILGSDGTISGTPTVTSASTTYTITGTNGCGNSTTAVTIATGIAATISNFNNISKMFHDGSYSIVAPTSNSTGVFSYTSSNPAVATISETTVTILGAGTSTITANQAANASYNSTSITATLTVSGVSVLTKGGGISDTNLNYVNQYGQIGGDFGLGANGGILKAKTVFSIGDSYGGGIVAYILVNGDVGYDQNVQHGIIAAVADQSAGAKWGCSGTFISGTSSAIGFGQANTTIILNACSDLGTAAKVCDDYSITVDGILYNDWYLPSDSELTAMYANKLAIGGFTNAYYWSSTESADLYACRKYFLYGNRYCNRPKTDNLSVRAARTF